jgi:hypothetical protein
MLFAIDTKTEEVIVSDSPKGSNEIKFIDSDDYICNENINLKKF